MSIEQVWLVNGEIYDTLMEAKLAEAFGKCIPLEQVPSMVEYLVVYREDFLSALQERDYNSELAKLYEPFLHKAPDYTVCIATDANGEVYAYSSEEITPDFRIQHGKWKWKNAYHLHNRLIGHIRDLPEDFNWTQSKWRFTK